jgi:hypothetical protein
MKPAPENVDGRLVETHEFSHAVEHQVNWSHFLLAAVVLVAIFKLAPAAARMADSEERDGR